MLTDDRVEQLQAQGQARRIFGCLGLIAGIALTSSSMWVDIEGGHAQLDGHTGPIPSARKECRAGDALAASSEGWSTAVAYYLPNTDVIYTRIIDGTEALTSAGAVKPTEDDISDALPSTAIWAIMFDAKFVRDSGTIVTCTLDRSRRAFGVVADGVVAAPKTSADGALWRHAGRMLLWSGLAATIADGDLLTDMVVPAIKGRFTNLHAVATKAITTAAKTTALHLEIAAVACTGTLTFAATKALGVVGTQAISANNEFVPGNVFSLLAASTTAFIEGEINIYADYEEFIG